MSDSELEQLVQGLDAVVWQALDEAWAFTFVSDGAERLFGYPRSRWLDEPGFFRGLIHPEDRDTAVAATASAAADRRAYRLEYRVNAAGGEERWVRETGQADTGPGGRLRLRGILVDITERCGSQAWLERAWGEEQELTRRLQSLNDMKNSYLTAVSHEMRTPLSTILGIALTLQRSSARLSDDVAADLVARLAGNARKLDHLLTDLLDLDRLHRGMLAPERAVTDVAALTRRVVEESGVSGDRVVRVEAEPAMVSVDPTKTERILENLFTNTVRHTPAGTPVWVRVTREDGGVLLAVEDAGPGVPSALHKRIFEPFQQVDGASAGGGVGVGLSLVARFAELHGGRAWVEDREGGGASFRVFLPEGVPVATGPRM